MISFNNIKDIANILKEAGKIEQYKQILEFQQMLIEMQNKNKKLRDENDGLKEELKYKGKINFEDPFYYITEKEQKIGPFCIACWDKDKKLIRIPNAGKGEYQVVCPVCHNSYMDSSYTAPKAIQSKRNWFDY